MRRLRANGPVSATGDRFIILISNTDDHLRNHGFLYEGTSGWGLSPAYDLNPVPSDIKPRILTTAINEDDTTASLQLALDTSTYFGLTSSSSREIVAEVGAAVARWRDVAATFGLTKAQVERMAPAFEHADLALACKGSTERR